MERFRYFMILLILIIIKAIEEMKIKSFQIKPNHQKLVISEYKSINNGYRPCSFQIKQTENITVTDEKLQIPKRVLASKSSSVLHQNKTIFNDKTVLKIQKMPWAVRIKSKSMVNFQRENKQPAEKPKPQLLKTRSNVKTQKLDLAKFSYSFKQKSLQTSFQAQFDPAQSFQSLSSQIYRCLCQKHIIQPKGNLSIIKKPKFVEFITNFTKSLASNSNLLSLPSQEESQLVTTLKKARVLLNKTNLSQIKSKLTMDSKNIEIHQQLKDYKRKIQDLNAHITQAESQKSRLQVDIQALTSEYQTLGNKCTQKHNNITQLCRQIQTLKSQIEKKTLKYEQIKQKGQSQQAQLNKIKEKIDNILHFVQRQQQKKVLHWVSDSYKKIQGQIYGYASYLQCNAMASSLTWEPKPFRAVEKWIYEQEERVQKFLASQSASQSEKSAKMKEFVMNSMRKFKTKDEQMTKMTDFKTECIKKFIKMMEKWIQNWQLKQEFLVGLRSEFAVDSDKINSLLLQLLSEKGSRNINENVSNNLKDLKKVWEKVELNYKYGNSFY